MDTKALLVMIRIIEMNIYQLRITNPMNEAVIQGLTIAKDIASDLLTKDIDSIDLKKLGVQ